MRERRDDKRSIHLDQQPFLAFEAQCMLTPPLYFNKLIWAESQRQHTATTHTHTHTMLLCLEALCMYVCVGLSGLWGRVTLTLLVCSWMFKRANQTCIFSSSLNEFRRIEDKSNLESYILCCLFGRYRQVKEANILLTFSLHASWGDQLTP